MKVDDLLNFTAGWIKLDDNVSIKLLYSHKTSRLGVAKFNMITFFNLLNIFNKVIIRESVLY